MTVVQMLVLWIAISVSIAVFMALLDVLWCIDCDEYKKAATMGIVAAILTVIVFAAVLIAF